MQELISTQGELLKRSIIWSHMSFSLKTNLQEEANLNDDN